MAELCCFLLWGWVLEVVFLPCFCLFVVSVCVSVLVWVWVWVSVWVLLSQMSVCVLALSVFSDFVSTSAICVYVTRVFVCFRVCVC